MLLLGVTETLQLVDGAKALPTVRGLENIDEVVALGAPALAAAIDSIIDSKPKERTRLSNRLEGILKATEEDSRLGLFSPVPIYKLLPFSRESIVAFGHIREAAPIDRIDFYDAQTLAIARSEDATALLIKSDENHEMLRLLESVGIDIRVRWI